MRELSLGRVPWYSVSCKQRICLSVALRQKWLGCKRLAHSLKSLCIPLPKTGVTLTSNWNHASLAVQHPAAVQQNHTLITVHCSLSSDVFCVKVHVADSSDMNCVISVWWLCCAMGVISLIAPGWEGELNAFWKNSANPTYETRLRHLRCILFCVCNIKLYTYSKDNLYIYTFCSTCSSCLLESSGGHGCFLQWSRQPLCSNAKWRACRHPKLY